MRTHTLRLSALAFGLSSVLLGCGDEPATTAKTELFASTYKPLASKPTDRKSVV